MNRRMVMPIVLAVSAVSGMGNIPSLAYPKTSPVPDFKQSKKSGMPQKKRRKNMRRKGRR